MAANVTSARGGSYLKTEVLPPSEVDWRPGARVGASACTAGKAPTGTMQHINDLILDTSAESVSPSYLARYFSEIETLQAAFQYSNTPCVLLTEVPCRPLADDLVHVLFTTPAAQVVDTQLQGDICDVPWIVRQGDWVDALIRTQELFPESWIICISRKHLDRGLKLAQSIVTRWTDVRVTRHLCRDFALSGKKYSNEKKLIFISEDFIGVPSQLIKETPETLRYLAENEEFAWLGEVAGETLQLYLDDNPEEKAEYEKQRKARRLRELAEEEEREQEEARLSKWLDENEETF